MKKKYAALILGIAMTASLVAGCGSSDSNSSSNSSDSSTSSTSSSDSDTVYGQVTSIDGDTITIDVGTQKEFNGDGQGKPGDGEKSDSDSSSDSTEAADSSASSDNTEAADSSDASSDSSTDSSKPEMGKDGEQPSMLDLTGESKEITVDDGTEYVKQNMGGGPGGQGGQAPGGDQGEAPAKPSDDGNSDSSTSTPPEKPSDDGKGGGGQGEAPAKPSDDGNSDSSTSTPSEKPSDDGKGPGGDQASQEETISFDDISEGDTIQITFDEDGSVSKIAVLGMGGGNGGDAQGQVSYNTANEYTTDKEVSGASFTSTGKDENAILVDGDATVNLDKITVSKKSDNSTGGDNSSFYGVGAAVLGTKGTTSISNSKITTDSAGGAGVFAYGDAIVNVSDTTISTKQDTSGGIHVAGGGTLTASNLTVTTQGESSAAIRSDRGGGTLTVDGGSYTSKGTGSPAIYCTADITADNAELTATKSEAICIEGKNTIKLTNCNLTGNIPENEQNDCDWNVILYQSMSGDSEEGNSTFQMDGGSLTAKNGGMFYTTNTESTFTLQDVDITYAEENDFFLKCTGNSNKRGWGNSGENGAQCTFTGIKQDMSGNVIWDSISKLDFYMTKGSALTGAIVDDESNAGNGGDGYCKVYIDKDSTWTVTGDSTVSELQNEGSIVDESGKTVTIKGTDGTIYVNGTSNYTITTGSYSDSVDTSGANSIK